MHNPFVVGKTIYLRPLEREDALLLQPWFNDLDIRRMMRTNRPMNLRAEEKLIERVTESEHDLVLVIVQRALDKAIGTLGLHQIDFRNRHAVLGIGIGEKDFWGQGHGTEATALMVEHAFQTMNLNRVTLQVFEDNVRGLRAYEKVGFKKEGVLRQDNFREGRYWDTIVMGILRDEWQAARLADTPRS